MTTELHLKHRPTTLEQIIGQKTAVNQLKSFLEDDNLPHTLLLVGPSGTGKTTAARILSKHLGCPPNDLNPNYVEKNCADCRSIDDVREIKETMRFSGIGGRPRVWVLDEVVQLPTVTQQAFLKILEEPPSHVWFILCTTDSSSLIPTFRGRCQPVNFQVVPDAVLTAYVKQIAILEKKALDPKVAEYIGENSDGSVRQALVLLESALQFKPGEEQLKAVQTTHYGEGESLARLIFKRAPLNDMLKAADRIKPTDLEKVRHGVLGYTSVVMSKNPAPANRLFCYQIIQAFRDPWYSCGKAGLLSAIYEISTKK